MKHHLPKWTRGTGGIAAGLALLTVTSCANAPGDPTANADEETTTTHSAVTSALAPQLDPTTIPRFAHDMPRLATYEPTVVRNSSGQITSRDYTVTVAKFTEQQLPPGFPQTLLFGYGSNVRVGNTPGGRQFLRTSPGPKFEQTKGFPRGSLSQRAHRRASAGGRPDARLGQPQQLPQADAAVPAVPARVPAGAVADRARDAHATASRCCPQFDGTPDTWFTRRPASTARSSSRTTYTQPSSNQSAAFWYHDHSFGVTRLDVGLGLSGFSILRDPATRSIRPRGNARHPRHGGPVRVDAGGERHAEFDSTPHARALLGRRSRPRASTTSRARPFPLTRGAGDDLHARLLPADAAAEPELLRRRSRCSSTARARG